MIKIFVIDFIHIHKHSFPSNININEKRNFENIPVLCLKFFNSSIFQMLRKCKS